VAGNDDCRSSVIYVTEVRDLDRSTLFHIPDKHIITAKQPGANIAARYQAKGLRIMIALDEACHVR
jgi:hypothetical protein